MTTALVILAVVAVECIVLWAFYKAGEHNGNVTERNDLLEKGIEDAKKSTKVEESVAAMSDADVTNKLSKYKRPF